MAFRPRPILGSAGSRIKVILGETGTDYLYYFNEDDGDSEWQSRDWTVENGGPPFGLCRQMNNLPKKGRHMTDVAFDAMGRWWVTGKKRDGSGSHMWWGGGCPEMDSSQRISLCSSDGHVILKGSNGFCGWGYDSDLENRMNRINRKGETINFVRLFSIHSCGDGYFISDSEGTEWKNVGMFLSKELKEGKDPVLDVAVARDGSWIVIRPNRFSSSTCVSSELTKKLSAFYRNHANRQKTRAQEIRSYEEAIEAEKIRQEEEKRMKELQERKQREEAERRQKEMERKEKEASLKQKCDENDRLLQIYHKKLKPRKRVTAIGFSSEPGDAIVKRIDNQGIIEIFKPLHQHEGSIIIKDPTLITPFHSEENDTESLMLLYFASDKYEAAIAIYHCECHNGICKCTKTFSGSYMPQNFNSSPYNGHGLQQLPPPRPITKDERTLRFDEYKCAEKIDMNKLKEIIQDLAHDSSEREESMYEFEQDEDKEDNADYKKLLRCKVLEEVAKKLHTRLDSLPIDECGFVEYEVKYEHRDPSGRGRLFAIGEQVKISDDKYPRTTTLQGMQSDLRAALVGKFAHDIDCENSEVGLICSLAEQLDLEHLIPTIIDYRDNRGTWLRKIEDSHDVTESDAKRLVNIILSGGRYETWLQRVGISSSHTCFVYVKGFVFRLYSEISALRDQLLDHPRFKWTKVEEDKLLRNGRPKGAIPSALMPRIVQCCENEVLGIIHRTFHQSKWIVRSKVFDGLVVEPEPDALHSLDEVNRLAEESCKQFGWDICLIEKPLYGMQDNPIKTIISAREVLSNECKRARYDFEFSGFMVEVPVVY